MHFEKLKLQNFESFYFLYLVGLHVKMQKSFYLNGIACFDLIQDWITITYSGTYAFTHFERFKPPVEQICSCFKIAYFSPVISSSPFNLARFTLLL